MVEIKKKVGKHLVKKQEQELKKTKRNVVVYIKKMKQGFLIITILSIFSAFLHYFKEHTAVNYIFRFLMIVNGIIFLFILYTFFMTLISSIKIVTIKKDIDNYTRNFKY